MVGDVNLFLKREPDSSEVFEVECEVMVAGKSHCLSGVVISQPSK